MIAWRHRRGDKRKLSLRTESLRFSEEGIFWGAATWHQLRQAKSFSVEIFGRLFVMKEFLVDLIMFLLLIEIKKSSSPGSKLGFLLCVWILSCAHIIRRKPSARHWIVFLIAARRRRERRKTFCPPAPSAAKVGSRGAKKKENQFAKRERRFSCCRCQPCVNCKVQRTAKSREFPSPSRNHNGIMEFLLLFQKAGPWHGDERLVM